MSSKAYMVRPDGNVHLTIQGMKTIVQVPDMKFEPGTRVLIPDMIISAVASRVKDLTEQHKTKSQTISIKLDPEHIRKV